MRICTGLRIPSVVRCFLSLVCLASHALCRADGGDAVTGRPYFKSCAGVFEALQAEKIENHFLHQIGTDGEALQLLFDYGLIITKEYQDALLMALINRGVKIPDWQEVMEKGGVAPLKRFATGVQKIIRLPDRQFQVFVDEVLARLNELAGAKTDPSAIAQVQFLQVGRLKQALENPAHGSRLKNVFGPHVKATLVLTVATLVNSRLKSFNNSLPPVEKRLRQIVTRFGALAGFVLGFWINSQDYERTYTLQYSARFQETVSPSFAQMLLGGIAGAGAGYLGAHLVVWLGSIGIQYATLKSLQQSFPESKTTYVFDIGGGETCPITLCALSQSYVRKLRQGVLTIEEVCRQENICKLTPPQIAYMGHVDILQIQQTADQLKQDMTSPEGLRGGLNRIREVAENLRQAPLEYRLRMEFRHALASYLDKFKITRTRILDSLERLEDKASSIRKEMELLEVKPYQIQTLKYPVKESLDKGEMIVLKLKTDLATLSRFKLNQEIFLKQLTKIESILDRMSEIVGRARGPESEWEELADDVALLLETFKQAAS